MTEVTERQKEAWKDLYDWRSPAGDRMAVDEVCLFFNNATVAYGGSLYVDGMTKAEYVDALRDGRFSEEFARIFANKYYTPLKHRLPA